MNILITGGTGQIGHELARELASLGTVWAPTRAELDLAKPDSIREYLRGLQPALVVNAAGYTAVDRAESEPDLCARLNTDAPAFLAGECRQLRAPLVHLSTDYVFDGASTTPYVEMDQPAPLNVYGRTKLAGEEAVASAGGAFLILRTSWVYGARGRNFVLTMLRLARERETLTVVDDQFGAPTSASGVAGGVSAVLRSIGAGSSWRDAFEARAGVYHMTAAGSTTWFEFAKRILADDPLAEEQICGAVKPISTAEYPTPARRPRYSVLDNSKLAAQFGVRLESWTDQWRGVAQGLGVNARRAASSASGEGQRADRPTG